MPDTPPTLPGPIPPLVRSRPGVVIRGMAIHAGCVVIACVVTPLAMGSNIWPIAAVFWVVVSLPVALGTGAAMGGLLRRCSLPVALGGVIATGIALAVIAGIVISQNR
ncbi:MAG: hypothetical protein ACREJO_02850 [Phycisphaerales bacterium]